MYPDCVSYEGLNDQGLPEFVMFLSYPDPLKFDDPATSRQIAAIEKFYCWTPPQDFTHGQAHAMMCARTYAAPFIQMTAPHLGRSARKLFERLTAAYILSDDEAREAVISWSDILFERGDDFYIQPDQIPFAKTHEFQHYLFSCIFDEGMTVEDMG
jgi:hypothetical protein